MNADKHSTLNVGHDVRGNINIYQERNETPAIGEQLKVAVGITTLHTDVLVVRRKEPHGSLDWQFPAGIVKPGESPWKVVELETIAETGISVSMREQLGTRVHPVTGVEMHYFACRYLSGSPKNLDANENRDCRWYPIVSLSDLIPVDQIFSRVLEYLNRCACGTLEP